MTTPDNPSYPRPLLSRLGFGRKPLPDGVPMEHLGFGLLVETLLKRPENLYREFKGNRGFPASGKLLAVGLGSYLLYGLLVGSFSGGMQWWAAPVKITGGILFSAIVCLPSLYIFGCLARAETSLHQCFALLSGLLALSGVLLIGFLPVAWVFSTSIESPPFMGFLHLMFWFIALSFGNRLLRNGMRTFRAETSIPVRLWTFVFFLVALQMTTTLRPLLGPGEDFFTQGKQFVLSHWSEQLFSNTVR